MKYKVLALVIAGVLFLSPLAMAGELSSSDTGFLFSSDQVAATAISAEEMVDTQGQALVGGNLIHVNNVRACNNRCLNDVDVVDVDLDLL
jgi:hypothetical protein